MEDVVFMRVIQGTISQPPSASKRNKTVAVPFLEMVGNPHATGGKKRAREGGEGVRGPTKLVRWVCVCVSVCLCVCVSVPVCECVPPGEARPQFAVCRLMRQRKH